MKSAFRILSGAMQVVVQLQSQFVSGIRRFGISSAILCLLALTSPASGQNYLTSTGEPNFSTPQPVGLGFVDASNGNLHLTIPLGSSYPQRGNGKPVPVVLQYDSNIWAVNTAGTTPAWAPTNGPAYFSYGGWLLSLDLYSFSSWQVPIQNCTSDWYWMDRSGNSHPFHVNTAPYSNCPSEADAFAVDSSGYHAYLWNNGNMDIYAPDGTIEFAYPFVQDSQGNWVLSEDPNGNYLSNSQANYWGINDTLGRQIASHDPTGQTVTVLTSQGTEQYQLTYTDILVKTNFQSGATEYGYSNPYLNVLRSITLPDAAHSTYLFTYDCDPSSNNDNPACGSPTGQGAYYGQLIGVTLPTGGTENFSYQVVTDAYGNKSNWVHTYSSAGGTWTYSPQVLTTCFWNSVNCKQQTTVQGPDGTTVNTFQLNNGAWPIQITKKDTAGNTLSTVTNTWDFSQPCVLINCHGNSFIRLLSQQTTVPSSSGNLTKQVSYTYDPNSGVQTGNKTRIQEWRYLPSGTSFPSVADRTTYISYLNTGINNINRPLSITVCGSAGSDSACPGGGSRVSQTLYTYDAYGASGLTQITGIARHDDQKFGAGYTTRGNPTSISRWVSGSNYLTTSYTYDTTGQILSRTDPAGNITGYNYKDSFYTDQGSNKSLTTYTPAQPTNAYATSVTDYTGTQTTGYYWGSGKAADTSDYNGAVTYYHYRDALDRKTEEDNPIGWSLATYSSAAQSDIYTAVADISPSTGCTGCHHTQMNLDQWGNPASQILVNNPLGPVEVDTNYNAVGELQSETHPYSGTSDPNRVFESYVFDALGRPLSTIHPDGQKTQTAYGPNVTFFGGSATQGGAAASYGYGYPQITMDEAGKQRQEWTDGFGNIIEVDEPSATTSAQGTGSITLSEGQCQQVSFPTGSTEICDQGTVSVTVFGATFSANYDQYDSGASSIAEQMNGSGLVTANLYGDTISVTAVVPGANSQITGSCQSEYSQYFNCLNPSVSGISGGTGALSNSPFVTNYKYDAGDRVTQVVQGVQTRIFSYDGLGREISETTPEAGTVTYSYTSGSALCSGDPSNVCQRTDARGVVTTYAYDDMNRLIGIGYTIPSGQNISPMPSTCSVYINRAPRSFNVCYSYGGAGASAYTGGRLSGVSDSSGSETYSYDLDGRVTQISKITNGTTYNIGYQYDAGGDVTQITYPSGRVVQQAYNPVGQLCQIAPSATSCTGSNYYALIPVSSTWASNGYDVAGHLINLTYGNGVTATYNYSPTRSQIASLRYAKGNSTYFGLQYSYQQSSPYSPNCATGTAGNNGSIECITDNVNSVRTTNYSYDALDRMTSATNGNWGLSETYDRYGNRWAQSVRSGSGFSVSLVFGNNGLNGSMNNRPNGYSYDASGNMIVEPTVPQPTYMTYDGESRMTTLSGSSAASYTYDGNGMRVVRSVVGGTTTVSIRSGSQVIAEYDNGAAPSAPSREYIYNPASGSTTGLLAMISNGATTYYHSDHLSVRLTTDGTIGSPSYGQVLSQEGHFPFGEVWYQSGPINKWFFTGKERDSESGDDYFGARYYASTIARFLSPDPSAGYFADPSNPQSMNLYAYVLNNPPGLIDPNGLWYQFSCYTDPDTWDPSTNTVHGGEQHCTFWDDGGGQQTGQIPQQRLQTLNSLPARWMCQATATERIADLIQGLANVGLSALKAPADFTGLVASVAGAPETFGASLLALPPAAYKSVTTTGQAIVGGGQLYTSVTGDKAGGDNFSAAGELMSGPFLGGLTLWKTNDMAKARSAANWESLISLGPGIFKNKETTELLQKLADSLLGAGGGGGAGCAQ